ncbi:MAG: hypothetical protein HY518_03240 [Candidatus Aenigmarchaeota archaeon]|nr:hypothetical protein [Candidatus Aenigmarchaeota archaeon]
MAEASEQPVQPAKQEQTVASASEPQPKQEQQEDNESGPGSREHLEKLQRERDALETKVKSLAEIIEMQTRQTRKSGSEDSDKAGIQFADFDEKMKKYLDELNKRISSMDKKIEKGKSEPDKALADIKAVFTNMDEKMKVIDKLPALENRLQKLEDKPAGQAADGNIFGGFGGLGMQYHDDMHVKELVKSSEVLAGVLAEFRDKVEAKLDDLDKKVQVMWARMSPETVRSIEEFVKSKDEIVRSVIPQAVKAEADRFLSAFSFEIGSLASEMKALVKQTERVNTRTEKLIEKVKGMDKRIEMLEGRK